MPSGDGSKGIWNYFGHEVDEKRRVSFRSPIDARFRQGAEAGPIDRHGRKAEAKRCWRGRISPSVEIELRAGNNRTIGPTPSRSKRIRIVSPAQVQTNSCSGFKIRTLLTLLAAEFASSQLLWSNYFHVDPIYTQLLP